MPQRDVNLILMRQLACEAEVLQLFGDHAIVAGLPSGPERPGLVAMRRAPVGLLVSHADGWAKGVAATGLEEQRQIPMFADEDDRHRRAVMATDCLRKRYGSSSIRRAGLLDADVRAPVERDRESRDRDS